MNHLTGTTSLTTFSLNNRLPLPRRPRLRLHNSLPPPARRPAQNPRPAIRRPLHHYQPCPAPDPRWPQTRPSPLARHDALGDPHGVRQRPLLRNAKQHAHVRRSSAQLTRRSRRNIHQRSGSRGRNFEYFFSAPETGEYRQSGFGSCGARRGGVYYESCDGAESPLRELVLRLYLARRRGETHPRAGRLPGLLRGLRRNSRPRRAVRRVIRARL